MKIYPNNEFKNCVIFTTKTPFLASTSQKMWDSLTVLLKHALSFLNFINFIINYKMSLELHYTFVNHEKFYPELKLFDTSAACDEYHIWCYDVWVPKLIWEKCSNIWVFKFIQILKYAIPLFSSSSAARHKKSGPLFLPLYLANMVNWISLNLLTVFLS